MTVQLPAGYTSRPARREDAEAVLAIYHSVSLAIVGEIEETIDDILHEWDSPELDLARDTRVVVDASDRIIGYGVLSSAGRPHLPIADLYTHPALRESDTHTEPYLIAWAVERARENLPLVSPELRVAVQAYAYHEDVDYKPNLEAAGFRSVRHFFTMRIHFAQPPQPGALPAGFRVRVATRDEDWRPIFDVRRDAWRDHFGYVEGPYEQDYQRWKQGWEERFAPGCWLLIEDDQTIAGICLCEPTYGGDEGHGWIQTVGVRRAYRQRGLAMALLQHAFVALYAMGRTGVSLGVDASSPTGAVRLYERAGMHIAKRAEMYELELRPGIDRVMRVEGA